MVIRAEDTSYPLIHTFNFYSDRHRAIGLGLAFLLICVLTFSTLSHLILFEWNSKQSKLKQTVNHWKTTDLTLPIQSNITHLLSFIRSFHVATKLSFIIGDTDTETPAEVVEEGASLAKSERSHLVVWQGALSSNQKTQY